MKKRAESGSGIQSLMSFNNNLKQTALETLMCLQQSVLLQQSVKYQNSAICFGAKFKKSAEQSE